MRLLVVTGFFGSGKTTFLLHALRLAMQDAGLRTVLVQNEIGRVGVDPEFFRGRDLAVNELLGGCLCCDLSTRLLSVLHTLLGEDRTDLVCVEASGLATPGLVRQILAGSGLEHLPALHVNLLDAARLDKIQKMLHLPVIRQGIECSDLCVVNKIDAVPFAFRAAFTAHATGIRPDAQPVFANLGNDDGLPGEIASPLRRFFLSGSSRPTPALEPAPQGHSHHGDPAVFAEEIVVDPPRSLSRTTVVAGFAGLVLAVENAGGIVAHIKAAIIGADGMRYFLRSTGGDAAPDHNLPGTVTASRVILNAIAHRISTAHLETPARNFLCIFQDSSLP